MTVQLYVGISFQRHRGAQASLMGMWTDTLCWVAWDHFQRRMDEVLQIHHNGEDKLQKVLHHILSSNPLSSAPENCRFAHYSWIPFSQMLDHSYYSVLYIHNRSVLVHWLSVASHLLHVRCSYRLSHGSRSNLFQLTLDHITLSERKIQTNWHGWTELRSLLQSL